MLGYLSLDIISSPKLTVLLEATLSENCSLLGTDNVRGQISEHTFSLQMKATVLVYICAFKSIF